jgi:outer membrane protein assembly factor BamA
MVGIAAFGADNHSRGVAVGGRLYLKEDKYRLTAALGDAEIYFDYYGAGAASGTGSTPYPLKITGRGGTGEFLWRIAPKWYIGPSLAYMPMKTALDVETPEALKALGIEELALKSTVASLGVHLQRDQRNDTIDPRKGSLFDVKVKANRKMWGSTFDYQIADASYKFFWSPRERQTLALWGQARMAGGRVPFYALSSYDLRGYTAGHHQDRAMVIGQAEYRLRLSKRWGAVAFAGTGAVAPDFSSFGKSEWLPGAGLGLRFALSKKSRMNLRLDYAWGRDGNRAVYFAVGEAF